jgi:hypothetical protein
VVPKIQGLRESSPVGTSGDPHRRNGHRRGGVVTWTFTWQWSLPSKSGRTDQSKRTAIPGLQQVRSRADKNLDPRQRCVCAPVFKRIESKSAHTS